MGVTLVLGAGGAAGWVFHAGVLRTLAEETGWDPRSAGLIVGTSAGSAVAAALRAGTPPSDIVAAVTRGPSAEERAAYQEEMANRSRSLRPLAPGLVRHVLPGNGGVAVALAGLLPPGWFPTHPLGRFAGPNGHGHWPEGLWIPAVRVRDGAVVVFGRDHDGAGVAEAVEASSAVPGLFEPKQIGPDRYLDGGLASPSHAHLAAEANGGLVVVSSPMTRPSRRPLARHARRRLGSELAQLAEAGRTAVVIQPGPAATGSFRGFPRRNPDAAPAILEAARAATIEALRHHAAARRALAA